MNLLGTVIKSYNFSSYSQFMFGLPRQNKAVKEKAFVMPSYFTCCVFKSFSFFSQLLSQSLSTAKLSEFPNSTPSICILLLLTVPILPAFVNLHNITWLAYCLAFSSNLHSFCPQSTHIPSLSTLLNFTLIFLSYIFFCLFPDFFFYMLVFSSWLLIAPCPLTNEFLYSYDLHYQCQSSKNA